MDARGRYRGSLLGLAAGDALGTSVEFKPPGSFAPLTTIAGGGPFHLEPGQWTDDTSMALCLAESLAECGGFDPADQLRRYLRWWREGHLSSTGHCFDIGTTTSSGLLRFEKTGEPYAPEAGALSAANGSIMRLAPVPLFFAADPREAIERAADSSRTTHSDPLCVDACRYMAGIIAGLLSGATKDEVLASDYCPVSAYWDEHPLAPPIAEIAEGSFKRRQPPAIRGGGYVVESLEAALWAFWHSTTFEDGCLAAANLGHDADTTAAVYGQIAGAHYGEHNIPPHWRDILAHRDLIEGHADRLYELAQTRAPAR
jgi:ADP-ribosylglycohydrolase